MRELRWKPLLRHAFFYEAAHLDDGRAFTALTSSTRGDGMWFQFVY